MQHYGTATKILQIRRRLKKDNRRIIISLHTKNILWQWSHKTINLGPDGPREK